MGIHITIQNNTFSDKSAAIKGCSFSETSSTDQYFDYIKELNELKERVLPERINLPDFTLRPFLSSSPPSSLTFKAPSNSIILFL